MKEIQYEACFEGYLNPIKPAKSFIPQWYKDIPKWLTGRPGPNGKTVKACVPFGDSFLTGYIVTLPYDILVEWEGQIPKISWVPENNEAPLDIRPSSNNPGFPTPHGYSDLHFVWKFPLSFKLDVGYSVLVTHPLNRVDLPFYTLSAVIDGGFAIQSRGNVPFYLQNDFYGVIPQGTPIAQIIPFKNEEWSLKQVEGLNKESEITRKKSHMVFSGWYKSTIWKRKTYN